MQVCTICVVLCCASMRGGVSCHKYMRLRVTHAGDPQSRLRGTRMNMVIWLCIYILFVHNCIQFINICGKKLY
jgi:hypothetical protein